MFVARPEGSIGSWIQSNRIFPKLASATAMTTLGSALPRQNLIRTCIRVALHESSTLHNLLMSHFRSS